MRLVIGSRKSELAKIQAYSVAYSLKQKHPSLEIDFLFKSSFGDDNLDLDLSKTDEKGVFTNDFYEDLINHKVDCVVHSWKDLPTEEREKSFVAATLPRADSRDLLIVKKSSIKRLKLTNKLRRRDDFTVLSSSPRRHHFGLKVLPELLPFINIKIFFKNIRGNIPTRFTKFIEDADADAFIVAKAAVDRLLGSDHLIKDQPIDLIKIQNKILNILGRCKFMVMPLSEMPAAAAQGGIAVEIRKNDKTIQNLMDSINHKASFSCIQKERKVHVKLGGGCHQKIGVSVLNHKFGRIGFAGGITSSQQEIDEKKFQPRENFYNQISQPISFKRDCWPQVASSVLFKRSSIQIDPEEYADKNIFVSRSNSLPEGFKKSEDSLLWCSGTITWKKLAKKGYWVSGCQDSLGESYPLRLANLERKLNKPPKKWVKFSHLNAPEREGLKKINTYLLEPKNNLSLNLENKKYFFWMSSSAFDEGIRLYPKILNSTHFCGPGATYEHIRAITPKVYVDLDYKTWCKKMNLFGAR